MRIATVDVGTNTILLLIAEVRESGTLHSIYEEERFVRLGEGVDANRRLTQAAMDRVVDSLHDYRTLVSEHDAEIVAVGATSASRDAANRDELVLRVHQELGLRYEVLAGEEEARWSFLGTCSGFPPMEAATVLDVGGGSTEIVSGRTDAAPSLRASLDVGAIRLTERHFLTLPPPSENVRRAETFVEALLATVPLNANLPLLGAAGTVTALARLAHPSTPSHPLSDTEVRQWRDRLLTMTADEVRALDPEVLSGRADVFAAGVLIVDAVMRHFGFETLWPSHRGLRHGLALRWWEAQKRQD